MKKKFGSMLVMMFTAVALVGCGEAEKKSSVTETRLYEEAAEKQYVKSNDNLTLTLDGDTTQFKLENKITGDVWYSNPTKEELEKHPAEGKVKNSLQSTLLIQYSNKTDTKVDIENFSKSIKNKNYTIEEVDGGFKVNYTIGEVNKVYLCPKAATESRMKEFLDKMDKTSQKLIKRNYVYYNYEELQEDEDRQDELDEATTLFPDLEKEPVYMLRKDITDSFAAQVEKAFADVGYNDDEFAKDQEAFDIQFEEEKPVFNVSVYYVLDGDELVVKVPMKEIQYRSSYPIVELSILPYMGCGSTDDKGFILVPDGNGGIINFNNGKTGQQSYTSDMYGWDYGISRKVVVDETKSIYPLFAVAKNGKSMLCTSEEGSAYSIVRADISGKGSDFNYGRFAYNMIHGETMDITTKSDTTVRVFESSLPDETITQRYMFTQTDDLAKMASTYRSYLLEKYPDLKKKEESKMSMNLEMVGAVDHIEHILGYPVNRAQALTKYADAKTILNDIVSSGVEAGSINAKYTGWFNGGVKQTSAKDMSLIGRLGDSSDLEELTGYATSQGIDLFMDGSFNYVYDDKFLDGFTQNRDAAKYASREIAEIEKIWNVTFKPDEESDNTYYLTKPAYAKECLEHFAEKITEYGSKNVSLQDYGSKLAGDYNPKNRVSREANMNMQIKSMKALKSNGSKLMVSEGNQYAVPYVDVVTGMNFKSKKVNIIDEGVPFYTMALHGVVDYTGEAINLADDQQENFLKSAETGASLYYVFMKEPTSVLQKGFYTNYYACNYDEWKDSAVEMYNRFNKELGDIYNQYIVKHEQVAPGVYSTKYENGKEVIVNYNYNDYVFNGKNVPKRDFITVGGGR